MPLSANTADKFIVDRSRRPRNSDVARVVRKTRDRLLQQPENSAFERELLKQHARTVVGGFLSIPFLVTAVAVVSYLLGMGQATLLWAALSIIAYGFLAVIARRVSALPAAEIKPVGVRMEFFLGHLMTGLAWSFYASLGCASCAVDDLAVIKAVVLLMAMAATAMLSSSYRGALFATFLIPIAVFTVTSTASSVSIETAMALLLIMALPFFTYVVGTMNRSTLMTLALRSEMDSLVAELETAKASSDEARRRAEDANLAKSRFLATMSHELRTPLNAILGFSEVMANEVLGKMGNKSYREYSQDIHESGQHLLELINEILDLSRIEAGRYQLNEAPVALLTVVEDCCHMMELRARNKDIRIEQNFEHFLPNLFADERAIRQITLNLLSNAIKFSPSGTDVLVRVGWTVGGGQYVSIKDNGPGIPPEELPVVLAAFGQGSIAIKSAEQGTGLGLPITQGLLALHGGEFELKSKLREGTEAIAIFPASRVMEDISDYPTAATVSGRRF
ncbi:HAMP domain-containing sensor histidine kinase [Corticibacterium sp. UT-5YL-CI-8]|nr:HAMP domain-containing sensor histidine kinase [Tianweitania sp. UT-5YL-CI-8]